MRKLSQRKVLEMVLNNWHRGTPEQHFDSSITATAWFLWLLIVGGLILSGLAAIVLLFPQVEEHCHDRAASGSKVECTQGVQAKPGRELDDVGHGDMVSAPRWQEYVHQVRA